MESLRGALYLPVPLDSNQHVVWLFSVISVRRIRVKRVLFVSLFEERVSGGLASLKESKRWKLEVHGVICNGPVCEYGSSNNPESGFILLKPRKVGFPTQVSQ